jgi:hypothetical protein
VTLPDTDYCVGTFIRAKPYTIAEHKWKITIEEVGEFDKVTQKHFTVQRTFFSREVSMDGRPLSELDLVALRGRRVQIRFLPGNKHEIWILNEGGN